MNRTFFLFLACGFSIFFIHPAQATELEMQDVSILLPLPWPGDWKLLPGGEDVGARGVLLPKDLVVEKIPELVQLRKNEVLYPTLRVIGIRIDPCFGEGLAPECHRQIRLVWQPLYKIGERTFTKTSTTDATLHSFYELTQEEFNEIILEIRELKKSSGAKSPAGPLGIHSVIKKEGLQGPYYQSLKKIIYKKIGKQNLTRLTFMLLFGREMVWFFGGINISPAGEATDIIIPRIGKKIQQFINFAEPITAPNQFDGRIFPAPEGQEAFNKLLGDSLSFKAKDEIEIRDIARLTFQIENPLKHNPGTLDCVTCHVAQPVKNWVFRNWDFTSPRDYSDAAYTSNFDLTNASPLQKNTAVVRMFGYFKEAPFVQQRVINESAQVLKFLNSL